MARQFTSPIPPQIAGVMGDERLRLYAACHGEHGVLRIDAYLYAMIEFFQEDLKESTRSQIEENEEALEERPILMTQYRIIVQKGWRMVVNKPKLMEIIGHTMMTRRSWKK